MNWKFAAGLALGFAIGFACAFTGIPAPAPPAIAGALLVLAMTLGYVGADRLAARRPAATAQQCGGPTGTGADRP